MGRLINLTLAQGKLVGRQLAFVRNGSHGRPRGILGTNIRPEGWEPKLEPFNPYDPSHGSSDVPEKYRIPEAEPNHGPAITMDYMPIPCLNYQKTQAELNRKFNLALGGAIVFFAATVWFSCFYFDIFGYYMWCNPESYRNRKVINARLRAEEAAAAKEAMMEG